MANQRKKIFSRLWVKLRLDFGGLLGGLIFFCLSFTPSLLPRGYILQGFLSGLSFATGYGLGVGSSHIYHRLPLKKRPALALKTKRIITVLLGLAAIASMLAGFHWQQSVRQITEAPPSPGNYPIQMLLVSALVSLGVIAIGRGIHHLGKFFERKLSRYIHPQISRYGGGLLAIFVVILLINGVLVRGAFGAINYVFGLSNKGTPEGIYQPQDSTQSGSPASVIDWNSLGEKGREFVGSVPAPVNIETFTDSNVTQPSRVYVGLESADTLQDRVNLVIRELERTKAADRQAILIAIPTGSGGINAKSVQSVEYLYSGNTTTIGIQYSYLPSWLSFMADQDIARQTGQAITEAVYGWWNQLNPNQRPKLLMYGESLGTLGADGAFSGASDMANRMSGILLAGPPNANRLWSTIESGRDPGSPQVLPIYRNGQVVRFSDQADGFTNPSNQPWGPNRVGILQNASDPVVWGSTKLFLNEPDWLKEPRGSDVLPRMRWYPFVTAWQVALDLPFAFGATPGHGHRYGNDLADSWRAILNIQLSNEKASQLRQTIEDVKG